MNSAQHSDVGDGGSLSVGSLTKHHDGSIPSNIYISLGDDSVQYGALIATDVCGILSRSAAHYAHTMLSRGLCVKYNTNAIYEWE